MNANHGKVNPHKSGFHQGRGANHIGNNPNRKRNIDYFSYGDELRRKGSYNDAIKAFNKAIYYRRNTSMAFNGKGECLLKLKEYDAALKCFESSIKRNPTDHWAYHGAGRAHLFLKRHDRAIAYFEQSISKKPSDSAAYQWKGIALFEMGEYEKAETVLKIAMRNATDAKKGVKYMNFIETYLKKTRAEIKKKQQSKVKPQIIYQAENIIQGDNCAPINNGGIQATGEAIINRPNIDNSRTRNSTDNSKAINDTKVSHAIIHERTDIHEDKMDKAKILEIEPGFFSRVFGQKNFVCSNCGSEVKEDQKYCIKCGGKLI